MATLPAVESALLPVEEYLRTAYRPDCDFVDGCVEERNVGEHDHGLLQTLIAVLFTINKASWGVYAVTDVRTQVSASRFRVPDLSILLADAPRERILTHPPLIVIEILSPEDRLSRFQERIDDYIGFGVEHIWILDPERRAAWIADRRGLLVVSGDELTVPGTPICVSLPALFAGLD